MTVIVGAASSRSNSKTKAPGRMSLTKLRRGSSGGQDPSSSLGGHPLNSADPKAPRDIKHRFEITRKLGSGTYGKVSLAYDHKTEREVAVKLIKKSAIENKQDLVRIRREIRIMSLLKHPNIIEIYEVFENKDKIILVMEYASGGELYDYVSKFGSLPEGEARRIFRQITSAILYCHKHKVAHRDLKLENILLDMDNNAKIADFGLSNYFNEKTLLHTFCGSPLYASPEIINGTPYTGPEVDCWSLGILLYTLVYGSMPFDGQDFNRMVRQIKRGAYYEPETPSTASMLIRNMLRVNPERRADIDEIASHWWLNLEENMPVIQELPENQILDHTPLTERAETMVVQDLADETDVFMEFGHLSAATRQKIEEFRRRRQHAEEYNENSPIKPPKARKTDEKELTSKEKSLRQTDANDAGKQSTTMEKDAFYDPLERLKQLETRLQSRQSPDQPSTSKDRRNSKYAIPPKASNLSPTKKEPDVSVVSAEENKRPQFVSPTEAAERKSHSKKSLDNGTDWKLESDSLNLLMNQVLEQMDKGPVSINLIARIKAHPYYDQRPMVKELLESIINAQPASVRKEASKVIDQAQGLARKQLSGQAVSKGAEKPKTQASIPKTKAAPHNNKYQVAELPTKVDVKAAVAQKRISLEERKWHSVEVGFETDEESSSNDSGKTSKLTIPQKINETRARSAGHEDIGDEEGEIVEDEEEYESEIDELAEVVEQIAQSNSQLSKPSAPKIVESLTEAQTPPQQQQEISADHLSTLERGLAKRISKGKYQHNHIELYGRGLSTEASSPPPEKQKVGGPQPTIEQIPVLFDKAKKFIMNFPERLEDSEDEISKKKTKTPSTKSQNPNVPPTVPPNVPPDKPATVTSHPERRPGERGSDSKQPAKIQQTQTRIPTKAKPETDEDSQEESEDEGEPVRPRTSAIIGFRTIQPAPVDTSRREAPVADVKPRTKPYGGINTISTTPPKNNDKEVIEKSSEITTIPISTRTRTSIDKVDEKSNGRKSSIASKVERRHSQFEGKNSRAEKTTALLEKQSSRVGEDSTTIGVERRNSRTGVDAPRTETGSSYLSERRQSRELLGNYGKQTLSAHRKSFHEHSPVEHDDFATVYGTSTSRNPIGSSNFSYGANRHGTLGGSRFGNQQSMDEEGVERSYEPSQSSQPSRRFEVYQTRAERAANEAANNAYGYRPATYIGGKSRFDDYSSGPGLRRPHDDRPFDMDPFFAGPSDFMATGFAPPPEPAFAMNSNNRFRPVSRRLGAGIRDVDGRRARARSHSSDQKFSGTSIDVDAAAVLANRIMPPENGPAFDYGYVSYHDSSSIRAQSKEPDISLAPTRGILKNKNAFEIEPRASQQRDPIPGPFGGFGLRRHLSAEKDLYMSIAPSPGFRYGSIGPSVGNSVHHHPPAHSVYSSAISNYFEVPKTADIYDSNSASKKRGSTGAAGFLNMARRKTAEIRLGNDGKLTTTTNGYLIDDEYKRPRSPIDRIKSLFTSGAGSSKKTTTGTTPGAYSAGSNGVSSRYTSTGAPSAAGTSSQFKRYTGPTTNTRFGGGRHWYD